MCQSAGRTRTAPRILTGLVSHASSFRASSIVIGAPDSSRALTSSAPFRTSSATGSCRVVIMYLPRNGRKMGVTTARHSPHEPGRWRANPICGEGRSAAASDHRRGRQGGPRALQAGRFGRRALTRRHSGPRTEDARQEARLLRSRPWLGAGQNGPGGTLGPPRVAPLAPRRAAEDTRSSRRLDSPAGGHSRLSLF